jgi:hypothetical protein
VVLYSITPDAATRLKPLASVVGFRSMVEWRATTVRSLRSVLVAWLEIVCEELDNELKCLMEGRCCRVEEVFECGATR